jgi:hypothetical protein
LLQQREGDYTQAGADANPEEESVAVDVSTVAGM